MSILVPLLHKFLILYFFHYVLTFKIWIRYEMWEKNFSKNTNLHLHNTFIYKRIEWKSSKKHQYKDQLNLKVAEVYLYEHIYVQFFFKNNASFCITCTYYRIILRIICIKEFMHKNIIISLLILICYVLHYCNDISVQFRWLNVIPFLY